MTLHKCNYCNREFKKESTLAVHMCEPKRRYMQRDDKDVQLGFRAYQLFYRIGTNSKKDKTYDDFAGSTYYSAFVKFGQYCIDVKIDDVPAYTTWLLQNGIKLDKWTSDKNFTAWIKERLKTESVDRAVERTILHMQSWAEKDRNRHWAEYFKNGSTNMIVFDICAGRVSPWVLYSVTEAQNMMDRLNGEQAKMIMDYADPQYWQVRMFRNKEDVNWVRSIFEKATL